MKTTKKGISFLLIALLLIGLFTACGGEAERGGDSTPEPTAEPTEAPTPTPASTSPLDDGPLAGIDRDVVMIEVEGRPVLWEEIFYEIMNTRLGLEFGYGQIDDWDAIFEVQTAFEGEVSYNEYVILRAIEETLSRRALEAFLYDLGETIDENYSEVLREEIMMHFGFTDVEQYLDLLRGHYLTENVFAYVDATMNLRDAAMAIMFDDGEAGVAQEDIDAFIENADVLRAKHILIRFENGNEDATEQAEALYAELAALSGNAQLTRFQEMLDLYGEDPGMIGNPDGYLFLPGVMVEEFTEGTLALELNEIGPPVASLFGYHIILRLPVDAEPGDLVMVPGGGQPAPLWVLAAGPAFDRMLEERRAELQYEVTPLLAEIVPSEIFARVDGE